MKKTFIALILIMASISHADVITCTFTEPFVTTIYSMTQSTLTYTTAGLQQPNVIPNVSFQIKDAGVFELIGKDKKVIQTLTLTKNGSDGMSDTVYPFEVQDHSQETMANSGIGGCSSNFLKVTKPKSQE